MGERQIEEEQMGESKMYDREYVIPLFSKRSPNPSWKHKKRADCNEENFGKLNRIIAKAGLAYLKTKGHDYDLQSTVTSHSFIEFGTFKGVVHGNFKAIKKAVDGESPTIEMFFVEAQYKKDLFGLEVRYCDTVDPDQNGGSCEYCNDPEVHHPVSTDDYSFEYKWKGEPKPVDLRSYSSWDPFE